MNGDMEVEISAGTQTGYYEVRVVRSVGGGEPSGHLVLDIAQILGRHNELERAVLASSASSRGRAMDIEEPVRRVGQQLFEALFTGSVYGAYRASLGAVQNVGKRLRVVLRLTTSELAALPWEALFDPETQTYLCRKEPLVRHVPAPYTQPPSEIRPPLRILGLVASPRGMQMLDVEAEQENLEKALEQPIAEGLVKLVWVPQASWHEIHCKLLGNEWHVLHFIGHGDYNVETDEGVLYLIAADGRAKAVEASRLADLLGEAQPPPRLIVLNSCSSGQAGTQDLFSGTAAVLAHNGIDAVAAMQYSITDTASIAFARGFYTALAHGHTVDDAARSGRVAIVGIDHTLEWVTPVLYVRGGARHPFIITPPPTRVTKARQNHRHTPPAGRPARALPDRRQPEIHINFSNDQSEANALLIKEVLDHPPKAADLIEFSAETVRTFLEKLCEAGTHVRLLMKHPDSVEKAQRDKIISTYWYLRDHFVKKYPGSFNIRFYSVAATLRGRRLDDRVINVGWYTPDVSPEGQISVWEIVGHRNPTITCDLHSPEGCALGRMFAEVFEGLWSGSADSAEVDWYIAHESDQAVMR